MKWLSLFFIILFFPSCQNKYFFLQSDQMDKRMVHLKKHKIWVSKYETTQKEYKAFLKDIQSKENYPFKECQIFSQMWSERLSMPFMETMQKNYHDQAIFDEYPVVNISLKGAQYFCHWLGEKYHKYNLRTSKKVRFRLPTKEEFASLMNEVIIKYDSDEKEEYEFFDFNLKFYDDYAVDGGLNTIRVQLKPQTYSGLCSVIGNVSELLADGEAVGGNWDCYPSDIEQPLDYSTPDPRIGFRIVMEVLEQ